MLRAEEKVHLTGWLAGRLTGLPAHSSQANSSASPLFLLSVPTSASLSLSGWPADKAHSSRVFHLRKVNPIETVSSASNSNSGGQVRATPASALARLICNSLPPTEPAKTREETGQLLSSSLLLAPIWPRAKFALTMRAKLGFTRLIGWRLLCARSSIVMRKPRGRILCKECQPPPPAPSFRWADNFLPIKLSQC